MAVAFAITINKSQGQSLSEVGIFLPRPVFSHGQLYVAISRVTSKKGLNILIVDKDGIPQKKTMNVVFKEIFNNLWYVYVRNDRYVYLWINFFFEILGWYKVVKYISWLVAGFVEKRECDGLLLFTMLFVQTWDKFCFFF